VGKQEKLLYFIALVPDEPLFSEALQQKEEIRDRFGSKAALRSPPHITLHMPFKWRVDREEVLFRSLSRMAAAAIPFNLNLNGFGCFEPRVIFIDVEENEALAQLQQTVQKEAAAKWNLYRLPSGRPFRSLMTIGFRDLKKPQFYKAWTEFEQKQFAASMTVDRLVLLKHNGKSWDIYKEFKFSE